MVHSAKMIARRFWWLAALLLAAMAGQQIWAALQESPTYDEGLELGAGYAYLTTGKLCHNLEQPPLQKIWTALPLLFLRLKPVEPNDRHCSSEYAFGSAFLFERGQSPTLILFLGRLMTIILTIALGAALAAWVRLKCGEQAALIALAFFAFDPNFIAHGHYTTADLAPSLFCLVTMICWSTYLEHGSWRWCSLTGLALGLALGSKFSTLFLLPAMVAVLVLVRQLPRWRGFLAATGIGVAVLLVLYLPAGSLDPQQGDPIVQQRNAVRATALSAKSPLLGKTYAAATQFLETNPLYTGLQQIRAHQFVGHPAYLLGKTSTKGWWYYFPVVFAVKTPAGTLLACLIALLAATTFRFRIGPWVSMSVPLALYFAVCLASDIDIGVRHLLPAYPFLYALIGIAAANLRMRWILYVALLLTAGECLYRAPYYTAFFNAFAGGPSQGPRYLADSNIDWGQDLLRLKRFMNDRKIPTIYLDYFGGIDPVDLGVSYRPIPTGNIDGYVAVSVTNLIGVYRQAPGYPSLRGVEPVARLGNSINVYDLRKSNRQGI